MSDLTGATGNQPGGEPELVKVSVDGTEVEVPAAAAQALERLEHDYRSRNDKLLEEGRLELKQQQEKLANDVAWYVDHPNVAEWVYYNPNYSGGDGQYHGPAVVAQPDDNDPEPQQKPTAKPLDNANFETDNMTRKKIDIMERTIINENKAYMEDILRDFPLADRDAVIEDMGKYYTINEAHPSKNEIRQFAKLRHDAVVKRVPGIVIPKNTAGKPAIPDTRGGGTPIPALKTPLKLGDIEGWQRRFEERMQSQE